MLEWLSTLPMVQNACGAGRSWGVWLKPVSVVGAMLWPLHIRPIVKDDNTSIAHALHAGLLRAVQCKQCAQPEGS
jgi:hypothetical protein